MASLFIYRQFGNVMSYSYELKVHRTFIRSVLVQVVELVSKLCGALSFTENVLDFISSGANTLGFLVWHIISQRAHPGCYITVEAITWIFLNINNYMKTFY